MDVLERLQDRVGLITDRVIGSPVERDGVTVIPVAVARGVGGAGGGEGPEEGGGTGGGGGWGAVARPVGAYVIADGRVTYEPAIDVTRLAIGGQILVAVLALLYVRASKRRRRDRARRRR